MNPRDIAGERKKKKKKKKKGKAQFKIFTSSLRRELSPTRTLKGSGGNRVQITCNTSGAYHMLHVVCHMVRRDSSVIKFFCFGVFFLRSPAVSLGFTTFGWDFCVCDRFFNPTIKVVTFRLRAWCVLGVFLLPAFTRLGHEYQDLLSLCDEMHVCTD